ncbi:MAG: hypothetical protein ABL897_05340 [Hyphomicrobium sp.]
MTDFHSRFVGREQGSQAMALVFLAAAWAVLAWPWLSGAVTVPWDAKAQFLPQLQFLASSFSKGESPFWAPYAFSGLPQIADPQALIFSPPFLLLAAVNPAPTAWAADVTLYAILLVSAAAMFIWLAEKGWHSAAALLSAIAFAFGAAMAWRIQHVGQVMSLAYLPVTLLCLDRAVTRGSWRYGIAAGIAGALLVLGRDQVALISVYFLITYVIAGVVTATHRGDALRRSRTPLSVALVTGLLVVAIPVALTALVAADSNRPSIDLEGAGRGSLHPALFLSLLAHDVFGAVGRGAEYWGPPSGRWSDTGLYLAQNMGQMYLGVLPAALLIWGAVTGLLWRKGARLFTTALVLCIFYGLGWYTPIFSLFHAAVPGVDLYRRPADAVFAIGFFASALAGFSLNEILSAPAPRLNRLQYGALATIPLFAFATMVALAYQMDMLDQAWVPIALPAAAFAAAAAMLYTMSGRPMPPMSAVLAIAAFMTADLAYATAPGGATGLPPENYDVLDPATKNATIGLLKQKTAAASSETRRDRVELVGFGFHWPNASLTHSLENTLGYNPLRLGTYTRATGAGDAAGLPEQKGFAPLFPSYRSRMADLLGLRYIATSVPIDQLDKKLKPGDVLFVAKTADGFIYENPRALPRAMFVPQSVRGNFDAMLRSGVWPDAAPEDAVVLEEDATGNGRQPGTARITAYHNTRVTLESDSPDGGFVVLNDIWQPWWFATLNDQAVPLLKANVLFRAVAVPPGRHTITFSFEPLRGAAYQLRKKWGN